MNKENERRKIPKTVIIEIILKLIMVSNSHSLYPLTGMSTVKGGATKRRIFRNKLLKYIKFMSLLNLTITNRTTLKIIVLFLLKK